MAETSDLHGRTCSEQGVAGQDRERKFSSQGYAVLTIFANSIWYCLIYKHFLCQIIKCLNAQCPSSLGLKNAIGHLEMKTQLSWKSFSVDSYSILVKDSCETEPVIAEMA